MTVLSLGVKFAPVGYDLRVDDAPGQPIRERTRRLVQAELASVAQDLFVANGYDNTTVEQIASSAGMSKRTFFRYFSSKDDLVIGKYELFADRMIEALDERPSDEPVWMSLRRVFDLSLEYVQDDQQRARNEATERIVQKSPVLNARYLERMQGVQDRLTTRVTARLGQSDANSELEAAAIVGAAFACMHAARQAWMSSDRSSPFGSYLDTAMASFRMRQDLQSSPNGEPAKT